MMTNFERDERLGMTIARWIGDLGIYSTTVAGAWGVARISIGVVMLDADAAGAGAFPDPNSSVDYPPRGWVFLRHCIVAQNGVGSPVVFNCPFDMRGMRKFGPSVAYVIVNSETLSGTTFTTRVIGTLRALILMP